MNKRSWLALLILATSPAFCGATSFRVVDTSAAPWSKILGAVGISQAQSVNAEMLISSSAKIEDPQRFAETHFLVLEGMSEAAESFGFVSQKTVVPVRQICDVHSPKIQIIWEQPVNITRTKVPTGFQLFATEKWTGTPMLAGKRTPHGAVLWLATSPGTSGTERYPYLLQALSDLGLPLPVQTTTLWAFFDSSYRIRADVDYLARRWRQAGVGMLHVAAWHNVEPDSIQDEYLKRLIEACHRNAILVYAWLELPHFSEKFWADHPEWREKTAIGQDAQLDWRKLMNLQNPDCRREVARETSQLLQKFDWDGVNVAELYFESLEGASNPARFTPMNDDVRDDFKRQAGFDPKLLFDLKSEYSLSRNAAALRKFLDYRAALASKMQVQWLDLIQKERDAKPYLDIVLTHIDDRFDPGIRDELGADVARSLPLMKAHKSTLLVEDPATLWDLGPERYAKLAEKYRELTPDRSKIAVDINVVERYQDVYPTKKQTGVELLELVHQAATSFASVALYFENSLEKQDLTLLPAAATVSTATPKGADELEVASITPTRVAWEGPVEVDGKPWPVRSDRFVLFPSGKHVLRPGIERAAVTISDFNGEIHSASSSKNEANISYRSQSRAIANLKAPVSTIEVDGVPYWSAKQGGDGLSILLPAGQHIATFTR